MSGNVWEWCLNEFDKPLKDPARVRLAGTATRPLRGGSWGYGQDGARAVFRAGNHPARSLLRWRVSGGECSASPFLGFSWNLFRGGARSAGA